MSRTFCKVKGCGWSTLKPADLAAHQRFIHEQADVIVEQPVLAPAAPKLMPEPVIIDEAGSMAVDEMIAKVKSLPKANVTVVPAEPRAQTREGWMRAGVDILRTWFPEDVTVPDVHVSIGWPAGRGSSRAIGQCWNKVTVADGIPAIFIAPSHEEPWTILDTLLHELVHAGGGTGHAGAFGKIARQVGLVAPWRSTPATPELKERLTALAEQLGPIPHAKVRKGDPMGTERPPVQSTRMLKVECEACGCVIRMTAKWIAEAGLPTCGCGEEMVRA